MKIAYIEGYEARAKGLPDAANPHDQIQEEAQYAEWADGYADALEDEGMMDAISEPREGA